jgi:hypothetical protein
MPRTTYWFRVRSEVRGTARGRAIEVHDASGAFIREAWADRMARAIVVGDDVVITRRRMFPLTGRVDIADAARGTILGRTSRGGVVRDAAGRELGRFRDARSLKSFLGEGFFDILVAIFTGGDASSTGGSGPTGYRWRVAGVERGHLVRAPWPFGDEPEVVVPRAERPWFARWVPERIARFLRTLTRPPVWTLEVDDLARDEMRVVVAGAIFAIELSHW